MKRVSPVSVAIIALVVLFVGGFAAVAFSQEKTGKDYKDLEGKEWAASDLKLSAGRRGGQETVDINFRISQIADGKATGTYRSKVKEENSDDTTEFTSRIETSPDGLFRIRFKNNKGANMECNLRPDGDFAISIRGTQAVLKRVEETK